MLNLKQAWKDNAFWDTFAKRDLKSLLIAYSGGLDSTVLLHLCQQMNLPARAVHVHHGLQSQADNWLTLCEAQTKQLNIPLEIIKLNHKPRPGHSIEAWAREQRYHAFTQIIRPDECLLTAHHQDDQAETLLVQLCRGAGVSGLAAMPVWRPFHQSWHGRPLLTFSRADLQQYADEHRLIYCEDPSNADVRFIRNRIRQRILPELTPVFPSIQRTLTKVANHCAEASTLLDELAYIDLPQIDENNIDIRLLQTLSQARQKNVLRVWIAKHGFSMPPETKLNHLLIDVINSRYDKVPYLTWANVEIRRYGYQLYVMASLTKPPSDWSVTWDLKQDLILPHNLGVLNASAFLAYQQNAPLCVRFRREGEHCLLPGQKQHKSLKKLMQTWRIPPWLRDHVPLVFAGEYLICALGYYIYSSDLKICESR